MPSAALLDEIGVAGAVKQAYTDGLLAVIDDIGARLAPDNPQSARIQTLSVFAMMTGTLRLFPAHWPTGKSPTRFSAQGIQNVLALLDAGQRTSTRLAWSFADLQSPSATGSRGPRRPVTPGTDGGLSGFRSWTTG